MHVNTGLHQHDGEGSRVCVLQHLQFRPLHVCRARSARASMTQDRYGIGVPHSYHTASVTEYMGEQRRT